MRFVAVDTETTGFLNAELIEVAAQDIESGASFCERIRPTKPIDPQATAVHGISNEDVSNCRNAQAVLDDFIQFLGNGPITLIAHNASFDKRMIESSFKVSISNDSSAETYTQIIPKVLREATWICTMKMSKQRYPDKVVPMTSEPVKHTLKDCCNRANIPYMDGHSALPDAQMCGKVQKDFLEQDMQAEALQQVRENAS